MLRSGIPREQVKHADREQAKRVVYSVVYGAGRDLYRTIDKFILTTVYIFR